MPEPTKTTSPTPPPAQPTPAQVKAQSDEAAKQRKEQRAETEAQLDEDDKEREEAAIKDGQERLKVKPTPSQRESDLARLGQLHPDDREPSGAPPEPGSKAAKDREREKAGDYKSRDLKK